MRFLKDYQDGTGPPDAGPAEVATERDLKDQVQYDAYRKVRRNRWHSAKVEHRYWTFIAEPTLYDLNHRVCTVRFTLRRQEGPQLRVQQAEPQLVR